MMGNYHARCGAGEKPEVETPAAYLSLFISIILAILFAYVVNSKYVFQDKCETLKDHVQPFCKFVSARLVTMVSEVGGVWLLVSVMGLNDMIGKFLTQFIVLILNYVFSKFFVFTTGKSK